MSYELTDYQGNKITVTPAQAKKIAEEANLLEVTVNNQIHYINKSDVASIKPVAGIDRIEDKGHLLDLPDFRGRDSPAKEALRKKFGKPKAN